MRDDEFCRIYGQQKDTVYRTAFTWMKNSADALDIVQETMIRLYRHMGTFTDDDHCRKWLIRVAVNLAKDMLRRKRFIDENEPDFTRIADLSVQDKEVLEEILSLPLEQRAVIYLHYYEGYTFAETAHILGITESAAKMRAKRAREVVKEAFLQED